MQYKVETSLPNFKFWGGAKDNIEQLTYSEQKALDLIIDDFFDNTPTEVELNSFVWHNFAIICEHLGLDYNEVTNR